MSRAHMAHEVVREAERTVYLAKWRYLEEQARGRLADEPGLAFTPLWPPSPVIQVVAYNGEYVGKIRLDGPRSRHERWYAVSNDSRQSLGPYRSPKPAAKALAHAARARDTARRDVGGSAGPDRHAR